MRRFPLLVVGLVVVTLMCNEDWLMASTTERRTQVLYVDVSDPVASDTNPGTSRAPVQTIGRAIELAEEFNARSVPVRVVIRAGTYREALELRATGTTTSAPISFVGVGDVTVSGSDVFTGWIDGTGEVYRHAWDQIWGLAPLPPGWENQAAFLDSNPVIRRREMVFVDGESLLQQMSAEEMTSVAGSFFVSEEEGQLSIHVPPGTDISTAVIEVAVRPFLLHIESRENITIKNIAFQHAATPMTGPAVSISESSNVDVINSRFLWNSWAGLGLHDDEAVTIQDVTANHNGSGGITGSRLRGLSVIGSEASFNGWRSSIGWDLENHDSAIDPNFIDFATGQKFFSLRDATFDHYRAVGNLTGGIWLDYDNANVTLEHVVLIGNLTHGLMVEASQGPVSVLSSRICGNETGIIGNNASRVRVQGNVVSGNLLGQVFTVGKQGPRPVVEFDTGDQLLVNSEEWVIRGNELGVGEDGLATGSYLTSELWSAYVGTLDSDFNRYSSPDETSIFGLPGQTMDLQQWRSDTGLDIASTFSASASSSGTSCNATQAHETPEQTGSVGPAGPTPGTIGADDAGVSLVGVGVAVVVMVVLAGAATMVYGIRRRRRRAG